MSSAILRRARHAVARAIALSRISTSPALTLALFGLSKVSRRAWERPCGFAPGGVNLLARPQDWLALDEIFSEREYGFVEELIPMADDPLVVDFGANIGAFSAFVLGRWPSALVHSVEASPDTADLLKRNCEMNGGFAWHVHHCAVWTHDGSVEFRLGGASTGRRVQFEGRGSTVPSRTLPTLLTGFALGQRRITLLKIDIEGAEEAVLNQAGSWLDRIDHLIVEVHPPASRREAIVERLNGSFRSVREIPRHSTKPLLVASK